MKKKKVGNTPRRKKMNRHARLQCARDTKWTTQYKGKHILQGYSKCFGVDLLCAVNELRILGIKISAEREAELKLSVEATATAKRKKKEAIKQREYDCSSSDSDNAGYTNGGVPYGIRWEDLDDEPDQQNEDNIDEIPF